MHSFVHKLLGRLNMWSLGRRAVCLQCMNTVVNLGCITCCRMSQRSLRLKYSVFYTTCGCNMHRKFNFIPNQAIDHANNTGLAQRKWAQYATSQSNNIKPYGAHEQPSYVYVQRRSHAWGFRTGHILSWTSAHWLVHAPQIATMENTELRKWCTFNCHILDSPTPLKATQTTVKQWCGFLVHRAQKRSEMVPIATQGSVNMSNWRQETLVFGPLWSSQTMATRGPPTLQIFGGVGTRDVHCMIGWISLLFIVSSCVIPGMAWSAALAKVQRRANSKESSPWHLLATCNRHGWWCGNTWRQYFMMLLRTTRGKVGTWALYKIEILA